VSNGQLIPVFRGEPAWDPAVSRGGYRFAYEHQLRRPCDARLTALATAVKKGAMTGLKKTWVSWWNTDGKIAPVKKFSIVPSAK